MSAAYGRGRVEFDTVEGSVCLPSKGATITETFQGLRCVLEAFLSIFCAVVSFKTLTRDTPRSCRALSPPSKYETEYYCWCQPEARLLVPPLKGEERLPLLHAVVLARLRHHRNTCDKGGDDGGTGESPSGPRVGVQESARRARRAGHYSSEDPREAAPQTRSRMRLAAIVVYPR